MKKLIILFSLFAITSCCCSKGVKIEGTTWKLVKMNGTAIELNDRVADDALTFKLDSTEMALSGRTDCNRFFGSYQLSNNNIIDINTGGMTRMACPNMEYEQPFITLLNEVDNYNINDEVLIFLKGDNEIATFKIFEPINEADDNKK